MDDDASVHDRVLWAIHMSGMDDLVKFLASSETEQQWSMHVLETVSLMFRDQVSDCQTLAKNENIVFIELSLFDV